MPIKCVMIAIDMETDIVDIRVGVFDNSALFRKFKWSFIDYTSVPHLSKLKCSITWFSTENESNRDVVCRLYEPTAYAKILDIYLRSCSFTRRARAAFSMD